MFITAEQRSDKAFIETNKRWLANVMLDVKGGKAPAFKLEGPCDLAARMRPRGESQTVFFIGNEEFHLSSVFRELDQRSMGETIKVTMAPAMGKAPKEIMAITMPLLDAIQNFNGLEDWLFGEERAAGAAVPEKPKDPVYEHQATRPSEQWGDF